MSKSGICLICLKVDELNDCGLCNLCLESIEESEPTMDVNVEDIDEEILEDFGGEKLYIERD